jgi:hypothetical protein
MVSSSTLSMYALVVSSTPSKGVALIAGLQVAFQSSTIDLHVHSHLTPDRFWHIVSCFNTIHGHCRSSLRLPSSSPGIVVANTNSVGASLSVWLASGVLAWTGASSFAELGSAIPLNGGAQAYLAYSYGPLVSFLFAWTAIIALKPGTYLSPFRALLFVEWLCSRRKCRH